MPNSSKPKVALVDASLKDRRLISRYTQCYFNIEEFSSIDEFFGSNTFSTFRGLIWDPYESGKNPRANLEFLTRKHFVASTLILTKYDDARFAVSCLKAGVIDYVFKPFTEKSLVEALDDLQTHLTYQARENVFDRLTDREKDVCDLIANGLSTKEIARILAISPRTVDVHRAKILAKVGVNNSPQLIIKKSAANY